MEEAFVKEVEDRMERFFNRLETVIVRLEVMANEMDEAWNALDLADIPEEERN